MPRIEVNISDKASKQMELLQKILAEKLGGKSTTSGFALSVALQRTFENLDDEEKQIFDNISIEERDDILDTMFTNMTDDEINEEIDGIE